MPSSPAVPAPVGGARASQPPARPSGPPTARAWIAAPERWAEMPRRGFPLPGSGARVAVAVPAPGRGPGWWAGASCAAIDPDGGLAMAYRVRHGEDGRSQTVIARSDDGETFTTVAVLDADRFAARWMARPALVRTDRGRWRLYVSCGSGTDKRWWIDVLEAETLAGLASARSRSAFPGDEKNAVKDPIVRVVGGRWHAWTCCHPLDVPGAEDRMRTAYATSDDGFHWSWHGVVLAGRLGAWDSRGTRLTALLPDGRAAYDGRATPEENGLERTGLAHATGQPGQFLQLDDTPIVDARYLDVLSLAGGDRIYYEARLRDESRELRTEFLPG